MNYLTMTRTQRAEAEAPMIVAVEARILEGVGFTYSVLSSVSESAGGYEARDRIADRTIQKWRRRGWIEMQREGRVITWSLTDAGRAERARRKGEAPRPRESIQEVSHEG